MGGGRQAGLAARRRQRLNSAAGVASQRALAKNKGKRSGGKKKVKIKRVKKGLRVVETREKRIKLIA